MDDDLSERPASPPEPVGGNPRAGLLAAGALLILLGFGLAVVLNLLLHMMAGTAGMTIGPSRITSTVGDVAWAVVGTGLLTGLFGVGLLLVARSLPRGPLALPGAAYPEPPGPS